MHTTVVLYCFIRKLLFALQVLFLIVRGMQYGDLYLRAIPSLGTILILRNQKDWVGWVSKMIMLHIK